jgi:TRAP-type transport system periplasmic protein
MNRSQTLAGLMALAALASVPAPAQVRVKLATLAPRGSSYHSSLLKMAEKWRTAPGGGATLTIYADGVQGGESAMVQKMRVGQLQAAMLTATGLSEIDDSITALQNMPMMFRSLAEVDYVREKLRPRLEKSLLDKGFVALFWGDAGWVRFFSKTPVQRPEDLKKLKLFVWQGDNRQVDLMKSAGYQPVPLETANIYSGLQSGMIDAAPSVAYYALAGQFYTVAKHMLEANWAPLVGAAVVSKESWDKIPAATRKEMLAAAATAGDEIRANGRGEAEQSVKTMQSRGLTVQKMTPDLEAAWVKAAESFYPQIRGKMVPADLFDEVVSILKTYRASQGAAK